MFAIFSLSVVEHDHKFMQLFFYCQIYLFTFIPLNSHFYCRWKALQITEKVNEAIREKQFWAGGYFCRYVYRHCKRKKKKHVSLVMLYLGWLVHFLNRPLSIFPCSMSPISRFHLALWSIRLGLFFWNTSAGQDWFRLYVGCVRFFFKCGPVFDHVLYRQWLSFCISLAASTGSFHRIISQCLWLWADRKLQGAITVSQFTWARSQTAFHQHRRKRETPCLIFGNTFKTASVTCFVYFAAGKELSSAHLFSVPF